MVDQTVRGSVNRMNFACRLKWILTLEPQEMNFTQKHWLGSRVLAWSTQN